MLQTATYFRVLSLALAVLPGCHRIAVTRGPSLDDEARAYVRLAVALGERDPDALDYYDGPPDAVADIRRNPPVLQQIREAASAARGRLAALSQLSESDASRTRVLSLQLRAIAARAELLLGLKRTFDEETEAFFGIHLAAPDPARSEAARRAVRDLLGHGNKLVRSYAAFDARFAIPPDRLPAVMSRALDACRQQTIAHLQLPPGESVTVEYVYNKPWSAWSYYKGNYHSVVQINTDFGLTVDRALQLACHEGYPGHHAFNVLTDQQLVRAAHRIEFSVQPVFSPQSLLSEAAATLATDIAFSEPERVRIEQELLFPLAGLRNADAARYVKIQRLVDALHPAELSIARDYADGNLEFVRAGYALQDQALMPQADAALKYLNEYRTYVVTYTEGQDLVKRWLDAYAARTGHQDGKWEGLRHLATTPDIFSSLRSQ